MKFADINLDIYTFTLSSTQLTQLLEDAATGITDNCTQLLRTGEVKILYSTAGYFGPDVEYAQVVLPCPADWQPFTVEATYYDNKQHYTQYVLASDEADAEKVAQLVCYDSNQGEAPEPESVGWEYLEIDEVKAGVHEPVLR